MLITRRALACALITLGWLGPSLIPSFQAAQASGIRMACHWRSAKSIKECTSGRACVWHFSYIDGKAKQHTSWCYKSKARAEKAKKARRSLCQLVSRWFDKTDCRTRYMAPSCHVCPSPKQPTNKRAFKRARQKLKQLAQRARQLYKKLKLIKSFVKPGATKNPYSQVGKVFFGYVNQLHKAKQRIESLRHRLFSLHEKSLQQIEQAFGKITRDLDSTSTGLHTTYPEIAQAPTPTSAGPRPGNVKNMGRSKTPNTPPGQWTRPASQKGTSRTVGSGWQSSSGPSRPSGQKAATGASQQCKSCAQDADAKRYLRECKGGTHVACYCGALALRKCLQRNRCCQTASCRQSLQKGIRYLQNIINKFSRNGNPYCR